jgi:hypothetical protein
MPIVILPSSINCAILGSDRVAAALFAFCFRRGFWRTRQPTIVNGTLVGPMLARRCYPDGLVKYDGCEECVLN